MRKEEREELGFWIPDLVAHRVGEVTERRMEVGGRQGKRERERERERK